jgi:hypothetical protein
MTRFSVHTSFTWLLLLHGGMCSAAAASVVGHPDHTAAGPDGVTVARWVGGLSAWDSPINWLPPVVPDNGASAGPGGPGVHESRVFFVTIDRDTAMESVVTLDAKVTIARLWIDANDALVIEPNGSLGLANMFGPPELKNQGHIALVGGLMPSVLRLAQTTELHGGGILSLENAATATVRGMNDGVPGSATLWNMDNRICGAGRLGLGEIALINNGVIDADVPFAAMTVQPNEDGCANRGLMQASGGGWLRLVDGFFDNDGGIISAMHGSFVELEGAVVHGGVLTSSGSGVVRTMLAPAAWRSLRNEGSYMLGPSSLEWAGHILNDGLIQIVGDLTASPGGPASEVVLAPDGEDGWGFVTLGGEGELAMLSAIIHAPMGSPDVHLVHEAPHLMRGEGRIGSGRTSFFNHGKVIADQNLMLLLNPGPGRVIENHGHLVAGGPAGMGVLSGLFENIGTVEVRDGSLFITIPGSTVVNASGSVLTGGTWRVMAEYLPTMLNLTCGYIMTNAADVTLSGPTSEFPRFDTVTFNHGTLRLLNGRVFNTSAAFSNYGELVIGAGSAMAVNGSFTQGPTCTLRFEVAAGPAEFGRLTTDGNVSLNGHLSIVLLDGVELGADDVLPIITAGMISGSFSSVSLPPGVALTYTPTAVLLRGTD